MFVSPGIKTFILKIFIWTFVDLNRENFYNSKLYFLLKLNIILANLLINKQKEKRVEVKNTCVPRTRRINL